jgi:hypothetical protein
LVDEKHKLRNTQLCTQTAPGCDEAFEPFPVADLIEQVLIVHSCKNEDNGCRVRNFCSEHDLPDCRLCNPASAGTFTKKHWHDLRNVTYEVNPIGFKPSRCPNYRV